MTNWIHSGYVGMRENLETFISGQCDALRPKKICWTFIYMSVKSKGYKLTMTRKSAYRILNFLCKKVPFRTFKIGMVQGYFFRKFLLSCGRDFISPPIIYLRWTFSFYFLLFTFTFQFHDDIFQEQLLCQAVSMAVY